MNRRQFIKGDAGALAVASVAFAAALIAFVVALVRYFGWAVEWSKADLQSRAAMTAAALAEPIRTLDFKAIDETAARLKDEGLRLRIVAGEKFHVSEADGRTGFYDTLGEPYPVDVKCLWGVARTGDFHVGVGRPSGKTVKPFLGAMAIVALAGIVGMASLGVVFFVVYRQRIRIGELARLEKFRRDFVADVSHEIRTPLTGILGAVDLMQDGAAEKPETREKLLGVVKGESKRLEALVQQILDLARLEREGDILNLAETDVREMARETAEKYGVAFCPGDTRKANMAVCDAQLLSQALSNLVENAIRHSGSDDITVGCGAEGGRLSLYVEDRGIGIPPDQVSRIFERFHRIDPARAAETGGAGLGLAIVQRIARLHGGDVAYSPVKPKGSRFEITLPAKLSRRA